MTPISSPGKDDPPEWLFGEFPRKVRFMHKFILLRMIRSFSSYQPILLGGVQVRSGDRECEHRWRLIEGALAPGGADSVLDLGCAEGYFVRQAAVRFNCVALGIDGDMRRITVAQNLASYDRISGVGFLLANIDAALIQTLPAFDVVIFCSLLHHIISEKGLGEARAVMQGVRACTRRTLIFDMGQSNETCYHWSTKLPAMEPDPATWIAAFLAEFGFRNVRRIGETSGYQGAYPRILFVADA